MPDPTEQEPTETPAETPALNNPVIDDDSSAALDRLIAGVKEEPAKKQDDEPEEVVEPAKEKAPEGKEKEPEGEEKPAEEPETPAEEKPPGEKPAEPPKPAEKEPEDALAKFQLSPHARPATAEQFANVKLTARQEIASREAKIAELQAAVDAAKTGDAEKLAALQKENEELRSWRDRVDIENDPQFKEYDARIAKNEENIYAKLKSAGLNDEQLKQIKDIGLELIKWDDLEKQGLPSHIRRYVETRLLDSEQIADAKREALGKAKENAAAFVTERTAKAEAQKKEFSAKLDTTVKSYLSTPPFSFTKIQPVPPNATPEQKSAIEADNKFAEESNNRIKALMAEDTPEARSEMIAATALAYKFQRDLTTTTAALKAEQTKTAELQAALDKIKRSSGAGKPPSSAPQKPTPPRANIFQSAEEALDSYHAQLRGD